MDSHWRLAALAVGLAACTVLAPLDALRGDGGGTDGGDADTGPPDASRDAGDGGPAACDLSKPFSTPVPVPELNQPDASSGSPRLSSDELTVYFSANWPGGAGNNDLFVATRASATLPFGQPTRLTSLNSMANDWDPTVSGDGLTLFFGSTRVQPEDLFFAKRGNTTDPFVLPQPLAAANLADAADMEPFVTPDGSTLYFDSNRAGGLGQQDIYVTVATAGGQFGPPQLVPNVSSSKQDKLPVVTPDELTMLLSSDRGGSLDIYIARRVSKSLPFDVPVPVVELSSPEEDYPGWISPDGCRVLLMSARGSGTRNQIYQASRPL